MPQENKIPVYPKVWGEEHWIVNRDYCGKKLILKKGFRCSIHYHKIKDEMFYVLSGKVLIEVDGRSHVLNPGDRQLITPDVKHRFTGLQDSEIMEFSTHHMEEDSYRDEPSGEVPEDEFNRLLADFG
jgi:mannose-6-phosphate isomerase-like protein (cupin superfamily)